LNGGWKVALPYLDLCRHPYPKRERKVLIFGPDAKAFRGKSYQGKKIENSTALADYFLDVAKVAVVPGIEFGADLFERLSYATSMEDIKEGLNRIEEALKKLS
jgi:aspartate aminotransferase